MSVSHAPSIAAGHLADNIAGFADLLRRSGMALGFDSTRLAAQALSRVDLADRRQVKAALGAVLIHHRKDRALFEAAFALFWREPTGGFTAQANDPQDAPDPADPTDQADLPKALEDALRATQPQTPAEQVVEVQLQATAATSTERLSTLDFAAMSSEESAQAEAIIRRFAQTLKPRPTRRFRRSSTGKIDLTASLKGMPRTAGDLQRLHRRQRTKRPDPLVILADVSGSMDAYTRPALIFAHALAQKMDSPVEIFVFATRLTSITRDLQRRDPDRALKTAIQRVADWSGGTRLGEILAEFNRRHLRRVLSSGGTCLLITDGLERGDTGKLETEARRLSRFSRLWWLNPLMRYDQYEPTAQGAAILETYAERRVSVHSLDSLATIGEALSKLD